MTMKRMFTLVLAIMMFVSMFISTSAEDVSFTVTEIKYNGEMLSGKVVGTVPAGKRAGVEVTFFLSGNRYIKTIAPMDLEDGYFELAYSEPAEYMTMVPVTFNRLSDLASRVYYFDAAAENFGIQ